MEEPEVPWQVKDAKVSDSTGGLRIEGMNHYTGETFIWHINHYGLIWAYRDRYGRFKGATFAPGARKRLAMLLRMARRDKPRPLAPRAAQ